MSEPWDVGIDWRTECLEAASSPLVSLNHVASEVLRVANDGYDLAHINNLLMTATQAAQTATGRALGRQRWRQVLSGFPCGAIVLQWPPLIEIESFAYVDTAGATQTLAGSPADYLLSASGAQRKARVSPLYGESWPATRCQPDAVTIDYVCGHEDSSVYPVHLIRTGIEMMVAEMYRVPELSIQGVNTSVPSVLQLDRFWQAVVD